MVEYLTEEYTLVDAPVKRRGGILGLLPGQSEDGYGKKITTDKKVQLPDGKTYRVYATCFSNVASHWIMKDKKVLYLR